METRWNRGETGAERRDGLELTRRCDNDNVGQACVDERGTGEPMSLRVISALFASGIRSVFGAAPVCGVRDTGGWGESPDQVD